MTKSELAKRCGVKISTISKNISRGKIVETKSGQIDTRHPTNKLYLQRHEIKQPVTSDHVKTPAKQKSEIELPDDLPQEIKNVFADMTIDDLHDDAKFRGQVFPVWEAREKILVLHHRRKKLSIENEERRGDLINKQFVTSSFFHYLENLSKELLDSAETLARQAYSQAKSAKNEIDGTQQIKNAFLQTISKSIQNTKKAATVRLTTYDPRATPVLPDDNTKKTKLRSKKK